MNKQEIKQGITMHSIETDKFKTNLIAVFLSTPLTKQNVTKEALLSLVLHRGSKNFRTQQEINIELEELYGATFDYGIEKLGNNHVLKFYIESIEDRFLPKEENNLEKSFEMISDIIFNPYVEENGFKEEYVESEKEKLKQIILSKIDNKGTYAMSRCIEEMYPEDPYGLYKYGYVEDLDKIGAKELYEFYQELLRKCKIDIFISTSKREDLKQLVMENENIRSLNPRDPEYKVNQIEEKIKKEVQEKEEHMEVSQGKLIIGMDILECEENTRFVSLLYNAILGGTATSKLFQNVREKESLAYSTGSSYLKTKNNIFILCGIDIENKEKTIEIVKKQLEDMKQGNFTEEEIQNTKQGIIETIQTIPYEQDTEITYYFGQELSNTDLDLVEYANKIKQIDKKQIVDLANKIEINTIYFLTK